MQSNNKRLLIQLDKAISEVNRDTLNPLFGEMKPSDILPIMEMVAEARGNYLKELFRISKIPQEERKLNTELVKNLRFLRLIYDELIDSYKALETAIERGYLDVDG